MPFQAAGLQLAIHSARKMPFPPQLTFDKVAMIVCAGVAEFGWASSWRTRSPAIATGRLLRVLEDWCPTPFGYHLFRTTRRQPSAAFTLLVKALRLRG